MIPDTNPWGRVVWLAGQFSRAAIARMDNPNAVGNPHCGDAANRRDHRQPMAGPTIKARLRIAGAKLMLSNQPARAAAWAASSHEPSYCRAEGGCQGGHASTNADRVAAVLPTPPGGRRPPLHPSQRISATIDTRRRPK